MMTRQEIKKSFDVREGFPPEVVRQAVILEVLLDIRDLLNKDATPSE